MQAKLPQLFGRLPKAPFEVLPVPEYLEKTSAPAYYQHGTPDGSRPGRLRSIPTTPPSAISIRSKTSRITKAFQAITCKFRLRRNSTDCRNSASTCTTPRIPRDGGFTLNAWAKMLGSYQDPYSDYGRLEGDIWRAIRLVVDTGVHSQHWTRQQMVDYFHDHSAIDETSIQSEVDRYIAWPSQALAYKIGQLKILELRDRAKKALGDKFDIRAFHDQVLDSGALPLDVLSDHVDAWIASQK